MRQPAELAKLSPTQNDVAVYSRSGSRIDANLHLVTDSTQYEAPLDLECKRWLQDQLNPALLAYAKRQLMGVIGVSSRKPLPKYCAVLVREAKVAQVESSDWEGPSRNCRPPSLSIGMKMATSPIIGS